MNSFSSGNRNKRKRGRKTAHGKTVQITGLLLCAALFVTLTESLCYGQEGSAANSRIMTIPNTKEEVYVVNCLSNLDALESHRTAEAKKAEKEAEDLAKEAEKKETAAEKAEKEAEEAAEEARKKAEAAEQARKEADDAAEEAGKKEEAAKQAEQDAEEAAQKKEETEQIRKEAEEAHQIEKEAEEARKKEEEEARQKAV